MPARNRQHYTGSYDARARAVRAAANANPDTRCWRCGQPARAGDPWVAGHTVDHDSTAPLAPEHHRCNSIAGGQLARAQAEPHSQPW